MLILIAECFTLVGDGVSGLQVRERWKGREQ
jgi:hypothetical protein